MIKRIVTQLLIRLAISILSSLAASADAVARNELGQFTRIKCKQVKSKGTIVTMYTDGDRKEITHDK